MSNKQAKVNVSGPASANSSLGGGTQIKPIYSDITLNIIERGLLEERLKKLHSLRALKGLTVKSDAYVLLELTKAKIVKYERQLKAKRSAP